MSRLASRPVAILTVLIGTGLAVLAGGRPWVTQVVTGIPGLPRVSTSGSQAAPAVTALALVAAAGAVALALTGRVGRRVIAGLLVLAGAGMIALVGTVLQDPAQAIAPALETATGQVGITGTADSRGRPALTSWPWPAMAGGLLVILGGGAGLVVGGRWGSTARRFEVAGKAGSTPPSGAEPALSGNPDHPDAEGQSAQPGQARVRRERVLEDWDALSRGEDPTAG